MNLVLDINCKKFDDKEINKEIKNDKIEDIINILIGNIKI